MQCLPGPSFGLHAWDPDDAFQSCHHNGENAVDDPHGLLYCAEGDLDKARLHQTGKSLNRRTGTDYQTRN